MKFYHRIPLIFMVLILMIINCQLYSQPSLPKRLFTANPVQNLSFGDLSILPGSSGGTVTVDYSGNRSSTGSVVLLNLGGVSQQAIYEFKLCPGRLVTITYPPSVKLTGSNGGSMTLRLGPTNLGSSGSSFHTNAGCDNIQRISQGGELEVGSIGANPKGLYTGTISITFNQQ